VPKPLHLFEHAVAELHAPMVKSDRNSHASTTLPLHG
jgi:hypothetical protein